VIDDLWEVDSRYAALAEQRRQRGMRSSIAVPLEAGAHRLGSLHVDHRRPRYFGQEELALARLLALQAGAAIERARLESALRESEHRYRGLVELSPDLVAVHQGGRLVYVNPAGAALLGAAGPADLLGRSVLDLVHPDDRPAVQARIERIAAGHGGAPLAEERLLRLDGVPVPMEIAAVATTFDGEPAVQVFARDLTPRLRADAARAAAQEALARREAEAAALQEMDRLKTEFLRTVSHELRTPLTVIHGCAELLAEQGERFGPEALRRLAGQIFANSTHLARLVDDLLDFERIERGELRVRALRFDLVPVLRDLLEGTRRRPGGARVEGDLPRRLPVFADQARIVQVVSNLLDNALKYAPQGAIVLRAQARPGAVRIQVEDDGPGIPFPEQPRLWEMFYRGERGAGRGRVPGSGIGLAVVKALVEAQGGRVGVESAPGQGTRFWFELPTAQRPRSHVPGPTSQVPRPRSPGRSARGHGPSARGAQGPRPASRVP
jgi:PAS domain S-box-containing protein